MTTPDIPRCCGTCASYVRDATGLDVILERRRDGMPHCKLTGKARGPESEKGCFVWKWDGKTRG